MRPQSLVDPTFQVSGNKHGKRAVAGIVNMPSRSAGIGQIHTIDRGNLAVRLEMFNDFHRSDAVAVKFAVQKNQAVRRHARSRRLHPQRTRMIE